MPLRDFGRRHRTAITIVGSLLTAATLVFLLSGHRDEFGDALSSASVWVLAVAVLLQIVALVSRSEAWHLTIEAAGGTVARRVLYRASSMQVLGGLLNGHLGVAARIAALRRSSPEVSPQVPTLIAAEFPILAIEGTLAALTSFTLVGPLGLPWWLPLVGLAVVGALSAGLRHLALWEARELWKGLTVLRKLRGGSRVVAFVLVAVFAQIFRNWITLHAVGVDASLFDAVAVLIALVTLAQLPVGPSVGAAAAVLILGSDGVAAAAAAGVLLTVTGTLGGLIFAAWAGADKLWSVSRWGTRLSSDYGQLPSDLATPEDDGAADHLLGFSIPHVRLASTQGGTVDLADLAEQRLVAYVYPMTGTPGQPLPPGWDDIPGARGCTPQSCAFRDTLDEFSKRGASVVGISTQSAAEQREFVQREHIPFPLLNDSGLELARAMLLPTFEVDGRTFYRRLTFVAEQGTVVKVFYPVFPPDRNAGEVLAWLS